jgi:hypothetical protein
MSILSRRRDRVSAAYTIKYESYYWAISEYDLDPDQVG